MELLERIISERPAFHQAGAELRRAGPSGDLQCYGIAREVLRFLADVVTSESKSLETGAGCSTLMFAIRGSRHTAITPAPGEIERIRGYCRDNGIDLSKVSFIAQPSELYLPSSPESDLDLVLIDGKHAFPWPILDWFFTADKLKKGGYLLLDDAQMRAVSVLAEFMASEPSWRVVRDFSGKTIAFQKLTEIALDVGWREQPWNTTALAPGPVSRLLSKARIALTTARRKIPSRPAVR